ncbi:MAG: DUF1028 domain-containing protein, partial [Sulfobacillus sp.]
MHPSTFSIVARDLATASFGVAVQSKFLAVGSVVPFAAWDAGAIATQAWGNTTYGPRALEWLRAGMAAPEVVQRLTEEDAGRAHRQLGVVDQAGRAAAYTGSECMDWAGHIVGDGFSCQGNILAGAAVASAMAEAFQKSTAPFAYRLVAALEAGQAAGGDRRGQESAALLVVRKEAGYSGFNDRAVDLRVDDHPSPIAELKRILDLHQLYFSEMDPADRMDIDPKLDAELRGLLTKSGDLTGSRSLDQALAAYHSRENFEDRRPEGAAIDRRVLEYMRRQL